MDAAWLGVLVLLLQAERSELVDRGRRVLDGVRGTARRQRPPTHEPGHGDLRAATVRAAEPSRMDRPWEVASICPQPVLQGHGGRELLQRRGRAEPRVSAGTGAR